MAEWFEYLGGMITVRIEGEYVEKVLNMAMSRGLYISDVRKIEGGVLLKVRGSGFEALKTICAENGYEYSIVAQRGAPFVKRAFRRRMGFLVGAAVFVSAVYILSSFIWFVDVRGNNLLSDQVIIDAAARYGVSKGANKSGFDRIEAENAMIRDISQLSYVKISVKGVNASIEVVEKTLSSPEITAPCNIVAAADGVIDDILVLMGRQNVRTGQAVVKGDILISGMVYSQADPYGSEETENLLQPRAVRARGFVKARVWRESYGECRLKNDKLVLAGEKRVKHSLLFPWTKNPAEQAGQMEHSFPISVMEKREKTLPTPWGNFVWVTVTEQEQRVETEELTEEAAAGIAAESALKSLRDTYGNDLNMDNSRSQIISSPSDSIIRVRVSVENIEEIGTPQLINQGV
ncbi:MAG: sporulation protein YqfD [Syntrophomonadaceae bacterium]|nr:sporulation protein YqfD [Syntrophomonadaceae bacterium]